MIQNNIDWLAGLLEGEGCFSIQRPNRKGRSPYPTITLAMTDEDIVRHAAEIFGITYRHHKYTKSFKSVWVCTVTCSRAETWMTILRPYMGKRRQQQIDAALKYRPKWRLKLRGTRE